MQTKVELVVKCVHLPDINETTEEWERLLSHVHPQSEIDRIKRFRFHIDAKRSCFGHVFARYYLMKNMEQSSVPSSSSSCTSTLLERYQLKRTNTNKPYLIHGNRNDCVVDLNISHGGDMVLLGFVKSCEIERMNDRVLGIDVEKVEMRGVRTSSSPYFDFLDTMDSCFTRREWLRILKPLVVSSLHTETKEQLLKRIELVSDEVKRSVLERFFIHWTLKESFMKATGMGVAIELQRMQFEFIGEEQWDNGGDVLLSDQLRPVLRLDGRILPFWNFHSQCLRDHIVSICLGPLHDHLPDISVHLKQCLTEHLITTPPVSTSIPPQFEEENIQLLSNTKIELIQQIPQDLLCPLGHDD